MIKKGQYWGCLAAQLDAARLSHFECWGRERVGEERLREVVIIIFILIREWDDHDDCCESGERERRGEGGGRSFLTLRFLPSRYLPFPIFHKPV